VCKFGCDPAIYLREVMVSANSVRCVHCGQTDCNTSLPRAGEVKKIQNARILHDIWPRKVIFPILGRGTYPLAPVSYYTPMRLTSWYKCRRRNSCFKACARRCHLQSISFCLCSDERQETSRPKLIHRIARWLKGLERLLYTGLSSVRDGGEKKRTWPSELYSLDNVQFYSS